MNVRSLRIGILTFLVAFMGAASSYADVPDTQRGEVEHLLEYVQTTNCTFERNGKQHTGREAEEHINRKYRHFKKKISTTEEFIELSATKSTMSGREYIVYCGTDEPVTSKEWLLDELESFRQNTNS